MCIGTHETRRVVVTDGLGVAERFQDGIGLDDLVLQRPFLLGRVVRLLGRGTHRGEVRDYFLRVLGFPGTRLTGDQHGLILAVCETKRERMRFEDFVSKIFLERKLDILLVSMLT